MADKEYTKYDSKDNYTIHHARLAKEPRIVETAERKIVQLTFVSTSRFEKDADLWVEATVVDRQADFASKLEKGDIISLSGKPYLRTWGDNNDKQQFGVRFAELYPSLDLVQAVKERGKKAAKVKPDKPKQRKTIPDDDGPTGTDDDIPF